MLATDIVDEINKKTPIVLPEKISPLDNVLQLVGLLLLLAFILAAAYYTSKFIGGMKLNQYKDSNFKVIDSYKISPNKILQLIQVGSKYLVIAICKDTVSVITELEESQVLFPETNIEKKINFKEILDKIRNK